MRERDHGRRRKWESRERENRKTGEWDNGIMGEKDIDRESGATTNKNACGSGKAFGVVDRLCCSSGGRCVATHLWLLGSHFGSEPQGGTGEFKCLDGPFLLGCICPRHKSAFGKRHAWDSARHR